MTHRGKEIFSAILDSPQNPTDFIARHNGERVEIKRSSPAEIGCLAALTPRQMQSIQDRMIFNAMTRGIKVLQVTMAAWASVRCLQGNSGILENIGLALLVPVLWWCLDASHRRQVNDRMRKHWDQCLAYPTRSLRLPWRATLVTIVFPLAMLYGTKGLEIGSADPHPVSLVMGSGDTRPVILAAASLILERDWELSEYLPNSEEEDPFPYWFLRTPGGVYSSYPSGMVILALPVTAAARLAGAQFDQPQVRFRLEKLAASAVAIVALGLFFLIALHLVPAGPAWVATMFLGVGSAMYSTVGQALWQHDGVILGGLVILLVEFRAARRPGRFDTWIQGGACALMLACRLSAFVFIVPFGVWVLLRSPGRAIRLGLVTALAILPWMLMNWLIYQNLTGPSADQMSSRLWGGPGAALDGVLLSPGRGLLIYQPWIVLALLAAIPSVRRRIPAPEAKYLPRGWILFCLMVTALQLALVSSWGMWWGGHCWGSRLASEIVPLLGLLCLPAIAALFQTWRGKLILLLFLVVSALMHLPPVFLHPPSWNVYAEVDQHPERLWSWSDPPFLSPFRERDRPPWPSETRR
jgi:hypothetical protein